MESGSVIILFFNFTRFNARFRNDNATIICEQLRGCLIIQDRVGMKRMVRSLPFSFCRTHQFGSTTNHPTIRLFPEEINVLYDGKCILCSKEINFLARSDLKGRIKFTDLENDEYDPQNPANGGIDYATGEIVEPQLTTHVYSHKMLIRNGIDSCDSCRRDNCAWS